MATAWQLSGDYFENCNCSVVCPCLISAAPPLTSRPTQGVCDVALAFHIDKGSYGSAALDGLNLVLIVHAPGPMADGNWTAAIYIDERATNQQAAALGAIFGGSEGGPMAAFAPLIATNLGVKCCPLCPLPAPACRAQPDGQPISRSPRFHAGSVAVQPPSA